MGKKNKNCLAVNVYYIEIDVNVKTYLNGNNELNNNSAFNVRHNDDYADAEKIITNNNGEEK